MSEEPGTYFVPIRKRENPEMYATGFATALESSISVLKQLEESGVFSAFPLDFKEGALAGLKAAREGIEKSLKSFATTQKLIRAGQMPKPEN